MSDCLKGQNASARGGLTAQQKRMASCNTQTGKKDLKGDERKTFMSRCLES